MAGSGRWDYQQEKRYLHKYGHPHLTQYFMQTIEITPDVHADYLWYKLFLRKHAQAKNHVCWFGPTLLKIDSSITPPTYIGGSTLSP